MTTPGSCWAPTCVPHQPRRRWAAVRAAVASYGLPRQLLSDNGLNFTGRLRGVTVAFERGLSASLCKRVACVHCQARSSRPGNMRSNWLRAIFQV